MDDRRVAWLKEVTDQLRKPFVQRGYPIPSDIDLYVAFPHRRTGPGVYFDGLTREPVEFDSRFNTDGMCERRGTDPAGKYRITISPARSDSITTAAVLVHELVHASVGIEQGHTGPFATLATALGLEGPMKSTLPGPGFINLITPIIAELGEYPDPEPRPRFDRQNLSHTIDELASAIRANLAAEEQVDVVCQAARTAALEAFDTTTAEARAAFELARVNYEAVAKPASEVRTSACVQARQIADTEIRDIRVATGFLLLAARAKVETDWNAWCKANVKRPNGSVPSQRDIRQMMELARSEDPKAALQEKRRLAREGMRGTRERRKSGITSIPVMPLSPSVTDTSFNTFEPVVSEWWEQASEEDRGKLRQWVNNQ